MPRLACIRPNSSNVVEFVSSWIAFGSIFTVVFVAGDFSVLKVKLPVSLTRTRPSHLVTPAALHFTGGGEAAAHGRVVGRLADDRRVLARLEHAGAVRLVGEGVLQRRHVECRCRSGVGDGDLHDGAGVGPVPGEDGRRARGAEVRGSGVVVVAGDAGREGRRCVVVEDQRLARELREVHDGVGPLGRSQQHRVLVDVAHVEPGRVGDPGGGLLPSMTVGVGRKPPSLANCTQSGRTRRCARRPASGRRSGRSGPRRARPGSASPRSCRCPLAGSASAVYHWRLKNRSLAALSIRSRYGFGSRVTFG